MSVNRNPDYSEHEKGERAALLQVRSFITKHGVKEVDMFCAQRLHDILMDAQPRKIRNSEFGSFGITPTPGTKKPANP